MKDKELYSLHEAYLNVYIQKEDPPAGKTGAYRIEEIELDEAEQSSMPPRRSAAERKERAKELKDRQTIRGIVSDYNKKRQPSRQEDPEKYYPKEEVDIYDIILSHLLDEGYAETSEAAEVIMGNMSEEWRDKIIDEATKLGYAAQKIANIARSKGDTKKESQARKLATKQFSSEADPAKHGKANVNRARQQARQRQERDYDRPEPRAIGLGERPIRSRFSGGNR